MSATGQKPSKAYSLFWATSVQGPKETCYIHLEIWNANQLLESKKIHVHSKKNSPNSHGVLQNLPKKQILITSGFQCPIFLTLKSSPQVPHCLLHCFWSPSYQQSPIHRFCDTTTIVTFSREVVQGLWRCKPSTGMGETNPFQIQTLNLLHCPYGIDWYMQW